MYGDGVFATEVQRDGRIEVPPRGLEFRHRNDHGWDITTPKDYDAE